MKCGPEEVITEMFHYYREEADYIFIVSQSIKFVFGEIFLLLFIHILIERDIPNKKTQKEKFMYQESREIFIDWLPFMVMPELRL